MSRKSVSQQLAELREYTARIEGELRSANETIATLKRARPAPTYRLGSTEVSPRRAAMLAAKEQAMSTGKCVPVRF